MEANLEIVNIKEWGTEFSSRPLIISGPCSAETESQVLQSAHEMNSLGIHVFRAGVWKPRTRPNSFEGVGAKALPWLTRVKRETGMLVATEVASVKHVYDCLKAGIDLLWIGARTSANPFALQEIAETLKDVDVPVLIKNPVNPDPDLWIGAIERFYNSGIRKIAAVHRGFSSYDKMNYRNNPIWQIPIELKRRIPNLSILCDPSHIAGKADYVFEIAQKAMDLNFDGLMIEAHPDPLKAWSDAAQQLSARQLREMLDQLIVREEKPLGLTFNELSELRLSIDHCDEELLNIISKRMNLVQEIGRYKRKSKMTVLQSGRWAEVLKKSIDKAADTNLDAAFISKLFKAIHQESINCQMKVMNG